MLTRLAAAALLVSAAVPAAAQRLPGTVVPVHYEITVAPDLAAASFSGDETITVRLQAPSTAIVLNAAEIVFGDVTIAAAGATHKARVSLDAARDQATLTVDNAIPAGEARLHIRYSGILNDDLRGLYLSKTDRRRYAVTQLEATDARRMFPGFDEPAFKATFDLTAIVDQGDTAISNGAVVSDTPGPAGKHTVKFATTPRMSSYLVALAVGDFECNEGRTGDIPIRICSTPDKKALTGFALAATEQIVDFYNRYYSIDYPFKKLDIVAVPDFAAGAMENTAAIFYREELLLAGKDASVGTRRLIAEVLAHEIAHQWFGDLVTMAWWDDLWLNEGFATWMQTKPVADWQPEWNEAMSEAQDNQRAMGLDALRSTRPLSTQASTPNEINELFDPIAYQKGAAVLRMVESWVGAEAFRKGVNAYIERFKYSNATAQDFWTVLTAASGKPVGAVMQTFVRQPGVPLVTLSARCSSGAASISLAQERFLADSSAAGAAPAWNIPVCIRTATGGTDCQLMTDRQASIALSSCPAWTIANRGGTGYYRTLLERSTLRALAGSVGALSPPERLSLISDEWAMVRAGRHDVGAFLELASGYAGERTPAVLQVLASTLNAIESVIATPATRPAFKAWVGRLLAPAARASGVAAAADATVPMAADDEQRARQATLLGALGGIADDPEAIATARQMVERALADAGSVDATLLNVATGIAAAHGDAALYDQYLGRSRDAVDPEVRYRYLYALTGFIDPALIRRTVDLVVSPEVRSQDAKGLLAALLANDDARNLAWELIRQRWAEIQQKTGEFVGNTVIVGALANFCSEERAQEIERFFAEHKVPDAERTLAQSLERIRSCAAVSRAQAPALAEWLEGQK